jgi:hypothetical protein
VAGQPGCCAAGWAAAAMRGPHTRAQSCAAQQMMTPLSPLPLQMCLSEGNNVIQAVRMASACGSIFCCVGTFEGSHGVHAAQGELWQLPASCVRRGHPSERDGFGVVQAPQVRCCS